MKRNVKKIQRLSAMLITSMAFIVSLNAFSAGNIITQERVIDPFTAIAVSGSYEIILTQGNAISLKIEGEEKAINQIKTEVKSNFLVVYTTQHIQTEQPVKIYITYHSINRIKAAGACQFKSQGILKFDSLMLEATGRANITFELQTDKLSTLLAGGGTTQLSGNTGKGDIKLMGAGDVKCAGLVCREMLLELSGSGSAEVHVTGELTINLRGSGSVKYKGNPHITQNITGQGTIKKM